MGIGYNDQTKLFCREYIKDFNGTRAAIAAGYSQKNAAQQASRLLRKANIQTLIGKLIAARMARAETDGDYVLRRLREIDELDIRDILTDDLEGFKPVSAWPDAWRRSISGIDIVQVMAAGDDEPPEKTLKKIKWPDKTRNLELLGRHIDVGAFSDRVEHRHVIEDMTEEAIDARLAEFFSRQPDKEG